MVWKNASIFFLFPHSGRLLFSYTVPTCMAIMPRLGFHWAHSFLDGRPLRDMVCLRAQSLPGWPNLDPGPLSSKLYTCVFRPLPPWLSGLTPVVFLGTNSPCLRYGFTSPSGHLPVTPPSWLGLWYSGTWPTSKGRTTSQRQMYFQNLLYCFQTVKLSTNEIHSQVICLTNLPNTYYYNTLPAEDTKISYCAHLHLLLMYHTG